MPNWCKNRLTITGDRKTLPLNWSDSGIFEKKTENLLFAQYHPVPEQKINLDQWRRENWGCKWDCRIEDVGQYEESLVLQFDSPSRSPIAGITSLSKLAPNHQFELYYEKSGCDFKGLISIKQGKAIAHQTGTFYGLEKICPNCGAEYQPEIDLEGNIEEDICPKCESDNYEA